MVSPSSFKRNVSWQFQLAFYCHRLCSIFIKISQKCVNNPNNVCYICREVTFASRKCSITPIIKKGIFLYFGCKVGDQNKNGHHTWVALRVHPNLMRRWMEKDVVCRLKCTWFGGCLATTVLTVISAWCPLLKMACPWRRNQHLCIRIYHQQFGLCLMAMDFLFLNFRTILLCTLTTKTLFLQTAKNSSRQLLDMQTTCQAQTPPIRRSQKASSVTSSVISNFQKIRPNFWHQGYNSGIYYTTKENGALPC